MKGEGGDWSWYISGYPWWNISWNTVIFKGYRWNNNLHHPTLLPLTPFLSCNLPSFYISLVMGPSLSHPPTLSLSSRRHQTSPQPPTFLSTHFIINFYLYTFTLTYPEVCYAITTPTPPPPLSKKISLPSRNTGITTRTMWHDGGPKKIRKKILMPCLWCSTGPSIWQWWCWWPWG